MIRKRIKRTRKNHFESRTARQTYRKRTKRLYESDSKEVFWDLENDSTSYPLNADGEDILIREEDGERLTPEEKKIRQILL